MSEVVFYTFSQCSWGRGALYGISQDLWKNWIWNFVRDARMVQGQRLYIL